MSLARKYRLRFGTPRGDRLLLYITAALAAHAGAATAAFLGWQELQAEAPDPVASAPIEFIYLDTDDSQADETARRAQSDARAQGTRLANQPINAGKATVAPQKATLADLNTKPVDATTLEIPGEMRPVQHEMAAAVPSSSEESKAIDETPPEAIAPAPPVLTAPSLTEPLAPLPSEVAPPAAVQPPPEPESRRLPHPPAVPAPPDITPPDRLESEAPIEEEAIAPPTTEEEGAVTQPILATAGLEGIPNPDRTGEDGPVQVAARQDDLLGTYAAQVNAQILEAWERISLEVSRQARVRFEIDRQGNLVQVELTQPSGSDAADQAALEAVRAAAPFEPFAESMTDERIRINLTFNYTLATPAPTTPSEMETAAPDAEPAP